jgi:3-dehydroquinate synthase
VNNTQRTVRVLTQRPYEVVIGPGVLERAQAFIERRSGAFIVLTDETVEPLYLEGLGLSDKERVLTVPPGEGSKSFEHLERVLDFMAAGGLDRASFLVALGGGVIGDLGGLAASLYMRGVEVVQCPTTLLSQVDSSVGGKTAVNLQAGKNLAGAFHQPCAVFADTRTLASLESEEFRSGLGEVVKSALIGDKELLARLEGETIALLDRDPELLGEIVERCVGVKRAIVERDEREAGDRRKLNLGHTFAHAIEHVAGYGTVPHGIAVGTGLVLALEASQQSGTLRDGTLPERVRRLLDTLGIPVSLPVLRQRYDVALRGEDLLDAMRLDKKGTAGMPRFILVAEIGEVAVDCELEPELLAQRFE